MFSGLTLGTADTARACFARACVLCDAALAPPGHARVPESADACGSARGRDDRGPHLRVTLPVEGRPAGAGHGATAGVLSLTRVAVDRFRATALAAGGRDAGAPGLRPHYGPHFYAAYVHDPDGNKLAAVCYAPGS